MSLLLMPTFLLLLFSSIAASSSDRLPPPFTHYTCLLKSSTHASHSPHSLKIFLCIIAILPSTTAIIILGGFKAHKISSSILLTLSFLPSLMVLELVINSNCNDSVVSRPTVLFFDHHLCSLQFTSQYFNI